jgi:threonine synthase
MIPLIERYRDRLPVTESTPVVTLGEGSTPLLAAPRLSERLRAEVWLKWEGANPTGSFKDRGLALCLSKALEEGAAGVACASTGNTAASAAAYAARAGLPALIVHARGAVAPGKLAQALAAGARVEEAGASFGDALAAALEATEREGLVLVNSLNPLRLEGQKTAAFEIVEELGRPPDVLALPYGGGGNTCAYAQGFTEATGSVPRLLAGEAAARATTTASAIRIREPVHRAAAEDHVRRSGGSVVSLTDDELLDARRELAELEGVYCEAASAAGLAAVKRERPEGTVVCVITGHGLKEP